MIVFENYIIDDEIATEFFSCDLKKCKGACCTFPGDYGAPLQDEEVDKLHQSYELASEYLSEKTKQFIEHNGIITGTKGSYSTLCINRCDCVFVYYEGDVAKCALERAYFDGKIKFRKPISCHLFPIRVSEYDEKYLYYQKFDECFFGREKGKANKTVLYKYLKEPLIRLLGEKWFSNFEKRIGKNGK